MNKINVLLSQQEKCIDTTKHEYIQNYKNIIVLPTRPSFNN